MTDLFTGPAAPDNCYKPVDYLGFTCNRVLRQYAFRRWMDKAEYERMVRGIVTGLGHGLDAESPGRYLRFIREKLTGTGFTVLNESSMVTLCLDSEADELRAFIPTRKGG